MYSLIEKRKRNLEIKELYCEGATCAKLGRKFNVSRERIRQIVNKQTDFKHNGYVFKQSDFGLVVKHYEDGLSVNEIRVKTSIPIKYVTTILRDAYKINNLKNLRRKLFWDKNKNKIANEYLSGTGVVELSIRYKMNRAKISNFINSLGVNLVSHSAKNRWEKELIQQGVQNGTS